MIYFLLLLTTAAFASVVTFRRENRRLAAELLREQRLFATLAQNIPAFARELRSIVQNPDWTPAIVNIEPGTTMPRYVTFGIVLDLLRLRGVTADAIAQRMASAILEVTNHNIAVQLTPEAAAMQAHDRRRAVRNLRIMASQVPLAGDPNTRTRVVEL